MYKSVFNLECTMSMALFGGAFPASVTAGSSPKRHCFSHNPKAGKAHFTLEARSNRPCLGERFPASATAGSSRSEKLPQTALLLSQS